MNVPPAKQSDKVFGTTQRLVVTEILARSDLPVYLVRFTGVALGPGSASVRNRRYLAVGARPGERPLTTRSGHCEDETSLVGWTSGSKQQEPAAEPTIKSFA